MHIGFWANLGWALAVYAPWTVGGVVGWIVQRHWLGVAVGVGAGWLLQVVVLLVALPVTALRRRR